MQSGLAWHALSTEEVLRQLESSPEGLGTSEASARLTEHGPNLLPLSRRRSGLLRLLFQFHNILIYVLLGAAGVTALLGHLVDTLAILAVVLVNAIVGFVQEGKAEKAMDAIHQMLAPMASALRDGHRRAIPAADLVPGDVVLLEAGDRIPADIRLIAARGLKTQEAALTGESLPVEKGTTAAAQDAPLGDRTSLVYSGTLIVSGHARGVVVETGKRTEIGRISNLIAGVETLTTPLVAQMNVFSRWLTLLILVISGLFLAFGHFVLHHDFNELFMAVVGLAVAAIPEGLPAVLTITLAIGVQAMARRNAIVRRLPAIETIGAVSVICTDKTGTLTRNEMMAAALVTTETTLSITGNGYEPIGEILDGDKVIDPRSLLSLNDMALAAGLCNDSRIHEQEGVWSAEGDPMEAALLALARKLGPVGEEPRSTWRRTDLIPFDSAHAFMATLCHDHHGNARIYLKGAPEKILSMCSFQAKSDGNVEPIALERWLGAAAAVAAQGQRVLAVAMRTTDTARTVLEFADVESDLVLLGLVGLIDPPRAEAIASVASCRESGIRVKMITGDHAATAAAIARQIGLEHAEPVLTGSDIDRMDEASLILAAERTDVFARTSPEHKLRLVTALQSRGLTVAMTGDGVNDAPALKRADAGIAMGLKGSAAAREAAEFVLADDNFASIVAAVQEGRTAYDNLKKVISWTLPTSGGEAMTVIFALLAGMTLPVTPVQILWVNLITAVTLGLALAFEPTEPNTMRRPPRKRSEPLLNGHLVWHVVLVSALFVFGVFGMFAYARDRGFSLELSRTIALNTLVSMEVWHLFFIRNIHGASLTWQNVKGTPVVWTTILAVTSAQFAITYLPPLQRIFGTAAVGFYDGILVFLVGVALFAIVEIEKQLRLAMTVKPARPQLGGDSPKGRTRPE